jgi:hypothetical protein
VTALDTLRSKAEKAAAALRDAESKATEEAAAMFGIRGAARPAGHRLNLLSVQASMTMGMITGLRRNVWCDQRPMSRLIICSSWWGSPIPSAAA